MTHWQPNASIKTLQQRSQIIQKIRQFFYQRDTLEVETPILASAGVTDLYLDNLTTKFALNSTQPPLKLYLQTSPEYAMKRLLAAGSGSIFQIFKAFRNDESGRYHNPEFSMLEWYRVGFDHFDLMAEMAELLQPLLGYRDNIEQITYQAVFQKHLNIDPLTSSTAQLKQCLDDYNQPDLAQMSDDKTDLLQFLFSQCIEPQIGQSAPCFVYDFPAEQASLAKLSKTDPRVAERFEVYYKGIELANGFNELTDPNAQLNRFKQDNQARRLQGKTEQPIDHKLIAALSSGLPQCAGVALGIDRLVMLALNKTHIDDVISFNLHTS